MWSTRACRPQVASQMTLLLELSGSQREPGLVCLGAAAKGGRLPGDAGTDGNGQPWCGQRIQESSSTVAAGSGSGLRAGWGIPVELGKGQARARSERAVSKEGKEEWGRRGVGPHWDRRPRV